MNCIVKKLNGARWSDTNKCWLADNNRENLKEIFRLFRGAATVDASGVFKKEFKNQKQEIKNETKPGELTGEIKNKLLKFKYWMRQKRYSDNTIKTYLDALKIFFCFHYPKPIQKINNADIIRFNGEYILKNNYSVSFQSQCINALKLFYSTIQEKELQIEEIQRPRKQFKLPNVLSKEEVRSILKQTHNKKHKAILSLIYGCGLRISEAINVKVEDIDGKRNMLHIRNAKGAKDRMAALSPKLLELLREYYKEARPKTYLFEGQFKEQYSTGSIGKIFNIAKNKAGIKKPATVHTLRLTSRHLRTAKQYYHFFGLTVLNGTSQFAKTNVETSDH